MIMHLGPLQQTYDLKNGSPKLQLNSAPRLGGSVMKMLLEMHVLASPGVYCDMKSRGSMGKVLPPI